MIGSHLKSGPKTMIEWCLSQCGMTTPSTNLDMFRCHSFYLGIFSLSYLFPFIASPATLGCTGLVGLNLVQVYLKNNLWGPIIQAWIHAMGLNVRPDSSPLVMGPLCWKSWVQPTHLVGPLWKHKSTLHLLAIGHMVLKISQVRVTLGWVNFSLTGADLSRPPSQSHERRLNSCDSHSISEAVGGSWGPFALVLED